MHVFEFTRIFFYPIDIDSHSHPDPGLSYIADLEQIYSETLIERKQNRERS